MQKDIVAGCIKGFLIICYTKTKMKFVKTLTFLGSYWKKNKKKCKNGNSWELILFGSDFNNCSAMSFPKKAELWRSANLWKAWSSSDDVTKSSSINTIHVKQQHNVGIFHFQVHSKVHARYNKIHARQCLYIISLYCREGFSHPFNFFVVSKGTFHI